MITKASAALIVAIGSATSGCAGAEGSHDDAETEEIAPDETATPSEPSAASSSAASSSADEPSAVDPTEEATEPSAAATPPTGLSGVVVVENDVAGCVPLCTSAAEEGEAEGDDWGFEAGYSCVLASTSTGANQGCTTGEALPEPENVAGVVVAIEGVRSCVPLCTFNVDPDADPEQDGWSWENNASCVIPGTETSLNQKCMSLDPVPEKEPRPGVIIVRDEAPECVPLCRFVDSESPDSSGDWGYEDNDSCLLEGSATASERRDCTFGMEPDYSAPELEGTRVSDGFFVEDGRLRDAYGNDFVIRGVNNPHAWYDGYAEYRAWTALEPIRSYGTNTVRIVWETTLETELLLDILHHVVELGMVPMVELHDATGDRAAQRLLDMASYYTEPEVSGALLEYREYALINIANEWSGGEEYAATYETAIAMLRDAGLDHTLVIDAGGFGQNMASLTDNWQALSAADPAQNLLFSIHMYDLFSDPLRVDAELSAAVDAGMPLVVGEFGPVLNGTAVAWEQIVESCNRLSLGYIAWSWTGNDAETADLDMLTDWDGELTEWGEAILEGPGGIAETAEPASIFQ